MASLRPRGADDLGLKRALSDRLLPLMVAAMAFLAALAAAGALAASGLAAHWRGGAAALLTVQVPRPDMLATSGAPRADVVAGLLERAPGITVRRLSAAELDDMLRPWIGGGGTPPGAAGSGLGLTLPAVFEVRTVLATAEGGSAESTAGDLAAALDRAAPGTLVERNGAWFDRLVGLANSLRACAALALLLVAGVAASMVAIAARAGLAARREAIEIVHGLGAPDGLIAHRFAARVTGLAFAGAIIGVVLAVPVLIGLAMLIVPFAPASPGASQGQPADIQPWLRDLSADGAMGLLALLPNRLWEVLPVLPVGAALIAWAATQATVRSWLARLP
jgi:cell division transport system permease protein